jgi:NADPH-dependent 2,4-dienoyl-CoA reductase/sulfur reductase-like enzyme
MVDHPSQVTIIGAGAAGIACALSAAERGLEVVLIEQGNEIGGTVVNALIHTLGGLFDDQGEILIPGLTEVLIARLTKFCSNTAKRRIGKTWSLSVDPAVYLAVVKQWISEHPRIHVHRQASIHEVYADVDGVTRLVYGSEGRVQTLRPSVLIDASGRAAIVQMLKEGLVTEGQALSGLIVQMRGVTTNALQFPHGVAGLQAIRKALEAGK